MVLVSTPSHTRALAEGARFVTTERSTGAGKVAMPSARAPLKKSATAPPQWGGLLGAIKKMGGTVTT